MEIVRVEQLIVLCNKIEKFVEGISTLCDHFCLEIANKDFLWELELAENTWVESAQDPFVQITEVIVPPADHGGLLVLCGPLHHHGVCHVLLTLLLHHLGGDHLKLKL